MIGFQTVNFIAYAIKKAIGFEYDKYSSSPFGFNGKIEDERSHIKQVCIYADKDVIELITDEIIHGSTIKKIEDIGVITTIQPTIVDDNELKFTPVCSGMTIRIEL